MENRVIENSVTENSKLNRTQNITQSLTRNCYLDYVIFPIALLILPLLQCNIGVDVTDTGYSLGGFMSGGEQMGETWVKFATYLANVIGSFFAKLPMGDTMLGMNVYTGLFVSVTALSAYAFLILVVKLPSWIAFVGEFLAISLCWCPTVILYNYLTYFFFTGMVICLFAGIDTQKRIWLFLAGIILGLDVMSRFPNITHAGLILSLWYAAWLSRDKIGKVIQDTLICLAGFLVGFGGVLLSITVEYGPSAYFQMIQSLFGGDSGGVEGHSLGDMVWSIVDAYLVGCKWMCFALIVILGGMLLFAIMSKRFLWIKRVVYLGVVLVLFRFYYGRGMFNFRYYAYESMFQWAVLFLLIAMVTCVLQMGRKGSSEKEKLLASMILLVILLTPLGSDNYLYPVINNLFLIAPVVLYWLVRYISSSYTMLKVEGFPVKTMLAMILVMLFFQSTAFGFTFVFRDGMLGEKRDTKITENQVLKGMVTNQENAEALEELTAYCQENHLTGQDGKQVILYGNVPALSCFMEIPSALSTTWTDLDSYTLTTMKNDMAKIKENPDLRSNTLVMTSIGFAAWLEEDLEAMNMYGVDPTQYDQDQKALLIRDYMRKRQYQESYFNGKFVVFE